ncbi:DUF1207 domain-containing protein [Rhodospirillaceae bacterium SYSU D60014]|uniref:DUF1207 domain-containing protein n=1 Tax=Virgifigura deserti TaxID=2268457 RepID=UPI0013C4BE71
MKRFSCRATAASAGCAAFLWISTGFAAVPTDDEFIAGYVAAILEREFGLTDTAIAIENGAVTITTERLGRHNPHQLETALSTVPGVTAVEIIEGAPGEAVPPTSAAEQGDAETPTVVTAATATEPESSQILPRGTLFEPLQAAPRWPHFSAAYQYANNDQVAEHFGAVSFGETLSLVRGGALDGKLELAFQAGVFATFDLDSESQDLINADYVVGIPLVYRRGDFSSFLRVYHQSSHLGDEFLLRDDVDEEDRINLSFEAVELLLSYDIDPRWRIYGGGGYLFHRQPDTLEPGMAQAGLEYESDEVYWDVFRPVAALDLQSWEDDDWSPAVSLRAGFQIGDPGILGQQLEVTAEYYNGRNPNGQFFTRDIEYYGIGLHLYFN